MTERSLDGSRLDVTAAYIAGMFQTNLGVVNDTFRMWLINFETIMFSILQPCLGPDNTAVAIGEQANGTKVVLITLMWCSY